MPLPRLDAGTVCETIISVFVNRSNTSGSGGIADKKWTQSTAQVQSGHKIVCMLVNGNMEH